MRKLPDNEAIRNGTLPKKKQKGQICRNNERIYYFNRNKL